MALPFSSPSLDFSCSSYSSSSNQLLPLTAKFFNSSRLVLTPNFSNRLFTRRNFPSIRATLTADSLTTASRNDSSKVLLDVRNLRAVIAKSRQEVLRGVNLTIHEGEVHAIMGRDGSGKSTFSKVLVGHPDYEVTEGRVIYKGENLLELDPKERSCAGIFLSSQSPVEIPSVSNFDFLHIAANAKREKHKQFEISSFMFYYTLYPKFSVLNIDPRFLMRNVYEGISGGEKKHNEILQLAVQGADLAILDEIDSGLDVDALQTVAKTVNILPTVSTSVLMIAHYQQLLDYIKPNYVHIMEDGTIIKTGDISLAKQHVKRDLKGYSEKNDK